MSKDPRPSLEERYGTHAGYVAVVTAAANDAVAKGYLLLADATALITQDQNSDVLNSPTFNIGDASYAAESGWVPSPDPKSGKTFQGSTTVPDLCHGGAIEIGDRATLTAMVGSQ